MRKLIVTEYISLDGVFEEPGQWSFDFWCDEAAQYKFEELTNSDALLLGRVTYEGFAKAWPTMEGTGEFGVKMNSMPKYVVSSTMKKASWNNSIIISSDVIDTIKKLKEKEGENILVAGSGELFYTLMEHNLIDEYRFMVHPVILGKGKRLFTKETDKKMLTLAKTQILPTGIAILHYHPKESNI